MIAAVLKDPASADAMLGTLRPFLYSDLINILDEPQSQRTPEQAAY